MTTPRKLGVNDARRVPCTKSKHHGFHPDGEDCPMCEPAAPDPFSGSYRDGYWAGFYTGCGFVSRAEDIRLVRQALDFGTPTPALRDSRPGMRAIFTDYITLARHEDLNEPGRANCDFEVMVSYGGNTVTFFKHKHRADLG